MVVDCRWDWPQKFEARSQTRTGSDSGLRSDERSSDQTVAPRPSALAQTSTLLEDTLARIRRDERDTTWLVATGRGTPRCRLRAAVMARSATLALLVDDSLASFPTLAPVVHAAANAVVTLPDANGHDLCAANSLAANDDGSSPAASLGFTLDFFGTNYTSVYVNNNGNITFDAPLSTFTPFGIASAHTKILAPFFGDVDTRTGSVVTYSSPGATCNRHAAFCADWVTVGYYSPHSDKLNSFQTLIVDRSDIAPGDFDTIFNYNQVQWETGDASGGTGGLGGSSAHIGYSNGSNVSYEMPG